MIPKHQLDRIRARLSKANGELKRLKRPPAWLFPHSIERQYTATLYSFTFEIRRVISEILLPRIPKMLIQATAPYPDPVVPKVEFDGKRGDDFIDYLNQTMGIIAIMLKPKEDETIAKAAKFGLDIAIFNQRQYEKTVNSVLGIDVFLEEPWLVNQLKLFANQNAQLITNMNSNEQYRVSGIVERGLQEGSSYASIAEDIEKSFGITRRHAKLIARDQTTKLNGSLTKLRQQNLGITTYRWLTAGDERVRPDHRVLDGKICRWDDPTVYLNESTGKWEKRSTIGGTNVHTSQDVNCFLGSEEVISFDTIKKIFRRFYSGEVVELITEEGFSFKSTPNHPVLTQKGWVSVNQIELGDNIICAGDQGFNILEMNIEQKKSTFNDLFTSIEKIFPFDTSTRSGQFHGDISHDKVDVISTDCILIGEWNTSNFKEFEKFLFAFSDYLSTQVHLSFDCSIYSSINRLTFAPESFISVFSQFLTLINSEHRNSIIHSFTSISNYDTLFNKSIFDNISTSVKSLRELFYAHSLTEQQLKFVNRQLFKIFVECTSSIFGSINTPSDEFLSQSLTSTIENFANMQNAMPFKIKTFRIVEKRSSIISAHVYNLETLKGYYGICKDRIQAIFHNCRCAPIPIIEGIFDGQ